MGSVKGGLPSRVLYHSQTLFQGWKTQTALAGVFTRDLVKLHAGAPCAVCNTFVAHLLVSSDNHAAVYALLPFTPCASLYVILPYL